MERIRVIVDENAIHAYEELSYIYISTDGTSRDQRRLQQLLLTGLA
jgi:hypothetical protein